MCITLSIGTLVLTHSSLSGDDLHDLLKTKHVSHSRAHTPTLTHTHTHTHPHRFLYEDFSETTLKGEVEKEAILLTEAGGSEEAGTGAKRKREAYAGVLLAFRVL